MTAVLLVMRYDAMRYDAMQYDACCGMHCRTRKFVTALIDQLKLLAQSDDEPLQVL
jgi:hypothetical protein